VIIPSLPNAVLESVSDILGATADGLTGSEIAKFLRECSIEDVAPGITKRVRLYEAFKMCQSRDGCANNVVAFIQAAMSPVRFTACPEFFDSQRRRLNGILAFAGLEMPESGSIRQVAKVDNLRDAHQRADRLRQLLRDRAVHPDVLAFCRDELLQENYFHAVLEAAKSVAEKIRRRTGLNSDGAELIDEALGFNTSIPHLALNSLTSESEKSEQRGFMHLLKGLVGMFRNPTAHAPRVMWRMEESDALDILAVVSLAHRKLDKCVEAKRMSRGAGSGA